MNHKHFASIVGAALVASAGSAQAAVFVEDFSSGYGTVGSQLAPGNGWTINEPVGIGGPPGPLSFVGTLGASSFGKSGALGGPLDEPSGSNPTISLSHSATGSISSLSMSVTFAILGSIDFPARDGFGFSLRDENGANVFSIGFAVAVNSAFQVNYTVGSGPTTNMQNSQNGDPMFMYLDGLYTLNLSFQENGANPTFTGSLVGDNTVNFNGVANGIGGEGYDRFSVDWNLIGKGGNHLVFDNVSVIPETSTLSLACLGFLGLIRRRR